MRNWEWRASGSCAVVKKDDVKVVKDHKMKTAPVDENNRSMDGTAAADLYNGVLVGSSIAAPGVIVNQTVPFVTVTAVGRSGGIGAVGVPRGARGGGNHHEVFKNKVDGDLGVRAQTSKTVIAPVPSILVPNSGDITDACLGQPGPACRRFRDDIVGNSQSTIIDDENFGVYPDTRISGSWDQVIAVATGTFGCPSVIEVPTAVGNLALMSNHNDSVVVVNNETVTLDGARLSSSFKDYLKDLFSYFGPVEDENLARVSTVVPESIAGEVVPAAETCAQQIGFFPNALIKTTSFTTSLATSLSTSLSTSAGTAFISILGTCLAFLTCCFYLNRNPAMAAVETIEMQEIVIGDDIEIDMNDSINRDYMRRQTYYQHQALIFELERHAAFISVAPSSNKIDGLLPAVATLPRKKYNANARSSRVTYAITPSKKTPRVVTRALVGSCYGVVVEGSEESGITTDDSTVAPNIQPLEITRAKPTPAFTRDALVFTPQPPTSPSTSPSKEAPKKDSPKRPTILKAIEDPKVVLYTPSLSAAHYYRAPRIILTPPTEQHQFSVGLPAETCLHNLMRDRYNEDENIICDLYDLIHLLHPIPIGVTSKVDGFYVPNKFADNYKELHWFIGGQTVDEAWFVVKLFSPRLCCEDLCRIAIFGDEYNECYYGEEVKPEEEEEKEEKEDIEEGVEKEMIDWVATIEDSASENPSRYAAYTRSTTPSCYHTSTAGTIAPLPLFATRAPWTAKHELTWVRNSAELEGLSQWFFEEHDNSFPARGKRKGGRWGMVDRDPNNIPDYNAPGSQRNPAHWEEHNYYGGFF